MSDATETQVVSDVARGLVAQLAPQELPLFRTVSAAYFNDPAALDANRAGRDDILGFGTGALVEYLTPAVLGMTGAVVSVVMAMATEVIRQRSPDAIATLVRSMFKPIAPTEAAAIAERRTGPVYAQRLVLHQLIVDHFDLSELKTLCFSIEVDFDVLAGETKVDRSRELVTYCERRARVAALLDACRRERPHVSWPAPATDDTAGRAAPDGGLLLSNAQLAHVRDVALAKARQLALPEDRAALLADALVGSLAAA